MCLRLTTRELAVLGLLAAGKSNHEIAEALGISDGTVKIHLRHVFTKLEVTSRTKAIVTAARRRLVRFD
jgi:DNA-binding NarL/FixJ family response regulator